MVGKVEKSIDIDEMHCRSCELILKDELNSLNSVACKSIDFKNGKAVVEFDESKIKFSKIKEAIEKEGYKVNSK